MSDNYEDEYVLLNINNVLLDLVEPWDNTDIIVCGGYYSVSFGESDTLSGTVVIFICVVNIETKCLPMKYYSYIE